jgi:catechol 2,3-dioxygenase-like lactoylglutathione lyase family enzyme
VVLRAFAHVTVGVADLDQAIAFWTGHFGFEVTARRDGADADLAALWNLAPTNIARQAIVTTPAASAGRLHLVEFDRPAPPVRAGARVFDRLPKNLDLYVRDIAARIEILRARGLRFRSDPVTATGPDGTTFREVHLPGHDETNVVLIEVIGNGYVAGFSPQGFAGVGPLVTIVPDLAAEDAFYATVLRMTVTLDIRLGGPQIEQSIGLPAGAALRLKVYGDPTEPLGRIEAIEYEGARGNNLFARARPPALGTLHVTYRVPDARPLLARLRTAKVDATDHGNRNLLYGTGRVVSFHSPAGFRIEVQESNLAVSSTTT